MVELTDSELRRYKWLAASVIDRTSNPELIAEARDIERECDAELTRRHRLQGARGQQHPCT